MILEFPNIPHRFSILQMFSGNFAAIYDCSLRMGCAPAIFHLSQCGEVRRVCFFVSIWVWDRDHLALL